MKMNRSRHGYMHTGEEIDTWVVLIRRHGFEWVTREKGGISQCTKDHGCRRWRCFGNGCGVHGIVLVGTRNDFLDVRNGWLDVLFLHENRLHQVHVGHQVVGFIGFETLRGITITIIRKNPLQRQSNLLFRSSVRSVSSAGIEVHPCRSHNPQSTVDPVLVSIRSFVPRRRS